MGLGAGGSPVGEAAGLGTGDTVGETAGVGLTGVETAGADWTGLAAGLAVGLGEAGAVAGAGAAAGAPMMLRSPVSKTPATQAIM